MDLKAAKLCQIGNYGTDDEIRGFNSRSKYGDIVGDLNRRRGQVNNMDDRAGAKVVKAIDPLSEMFGYVTVSLRTLSSGRATSTMEFSHYAQTPSNISDDVISSIKGNNQE